MSLQTRLFIFFITIVVLPLAVAAFFGQRLIVNELETRTFNQLQASYTAASAVYQEGSFRAADRTQLIAGDEVFQLALSEKRYPDVLTRIRERHEEQGGEILDFVVVTDATGAVVVEDLGEPEFLAGISPPTREEITAEAEARSLLVNVSVTNINSPVPPHPVGWRVFGGYYLDNTFATDLRQTTAKVDATVVIDGRAVSSTLDSLLESRRPVTVPLGTVGTPEEFLTTTLGGSEVYLLASSILADAPLTEGALVMSLPRSDIVRLRSNVNILVFFLMMLAVFGAGILGFVLARIIARPLREVASAANAIAAGNYEQHIEVRSRDEVGQLARSFNEMTKRLSVHISELRESREDLKRAYTRFGETLRATHDLESLLNVILENCIDTIRAERGALMLVDPSTGNLNTRIARGIDPAKFDMDVAKGVAGYVASTGEPVRFPDPTDPLARSPDRIEYRSVLSVPLFRQERVIGVVNIYDKEGEQEFSEADMGTLLSLADQAGVALDNVLLHEETKRLSITDGLTGIHNNRFFNIQIDQEINRSERFLKDFSLIVFDIDNFKSFNDTYGHLMGDTVLIEIAGRVQRTVRDVDTFARYGGEEFVIILPETDEEGGLATAEKIRSLIASSPIHGPNVDVSVTVTISVGVATYPHHGKRKQVLIEAADKAMYVAKKSGKNRVVAYRPETG